jgi:hypothetical protein
MANDTVRGRFVWHELYTPNPAGAREFYGKTVGWTVEAWEHDPGYQMFVAENGPVGASVEERSGTPRWLSYIGTADVDATADAAARLGGRVETPPTDLPGGGRYAVLVDPQGAAFGVHASSSPQPATAPSAGDFSWHELATNIAPGAAFGFYAALFDWDLVDEVDMGPQGKYLIFGRSGRQLGGVFDQTASGKVGKAYWLGYVSVADLEGTVEQAKGARGSVLVPPMDVPGGDRIAQLMDPYGAFFALHKRSGVAAAAADAPTRKPAKKAAPKKPAPKPKAQKRAAKKAPAKRAKPAARKKAAKKAAAKKPTRKPAKAQAKKKTAKKAKKRGR